MSKRVYSIGSRLYFHYDYDGSTEGYTIVGKEKSHYIGDDGVKVDYEMLQLRPDNMVLGECFIGDYTADEDGLDECDERVVKYKERMKEIECKKVSLEEVCDYLSNDISIYHIPYKERKEFIKRLREHFSNF